MDGEYDRLVPDYSEYRKRPISLGEILATGSKGAEESGE